MVPMHGAKGTSSCRGTSPCHAADELRLEASKRNEIEDLGTDPTERPNRRELYPIASEQSAIRPTSEAAHLQEACLA